MSYHSKVILWLQNDAYYLFNYQLSSKTFNVIKIYAANENPRCVAQDLSQTGVVNIIIYFCHQFGYIVNNNLSMKKAELVDILKSREVVVEDRDLIRCQALGDATFIQRLDSNTLCSWQNAMNEFDVTIDNIDFPEQLCLSLLPINLKHSGCFLNIGNIQGKLNMRWEINTSKFELKPMEWGISFTSSDLLHSGLTNVINRQLIENLDNDSISKHAFPIYSVEEAWELKLKTEDISDPRVGLLRASFESPLSVKALRSWGQTSARIITSLMVVLILVQLATPKSEQQYAVVTEDLISNSSIKVNDNAASLDTTKRGYSELSANIKELWEGIDELKFNAQRVTQKPLLKLDSSKITRERSIVMPVLNYLRKNEEESCGQFQLGLQKLQICKDQSFLGKRLVLLDHQTSTWIDSEEKTFQINRVNRVKKMKTRIFQSKNNTEYMVELTGDNSKSLIVDSWEGQPLKSRREAEIVAEAIATGILSGDRLDTTPAHSEARTNFGSLNSSKL